MEPRRLYLAISSLNGLLFSMAFTTYGLYAVQEAGLGPLALVLAGTALESAILLGELPTGMLADVYSRRLSVIVGMLVTAVGIGLVGVHPSFVFIAVGQAVWGLGYTFISGAQQAWLADEIGEARAAPVYLRAVQVAQAARLLGIPTGVGLAALDLQAPLLAAGGGFLLLGLMLLATMTERGYTPRRQAGLAAAAAVRQTLSTTARLVRQRSSVATALAVAVLFGAASEAFDRLGPLHLIDNVGLPGGLSPAAWFGVIAAGSSLGTILATGLVASGRVIRSEQAVVRVLLGLAALFALAAPAFALANAFWLALLAQWTVHWARNTTDPLMVVWVNRDLPPQVRATVLSGIGQAGALGEAAGGPALGAVAAVSAVRTALISVGVLVAPALALYGRQSLRTARAAARMAPAK